MRLVEEEKRRIIVSLEKTAQTWDCREADAVTQADGCQILQRGLAAYAAKQAYIQRGLADKFKATWTAPSPQGKTDDTEVDGTDNDGTLLITVGEESDGNDDESDDDDDGYATDDEEELHDDV